MTYLTNRHVRYKNIYNYTKITIYYQDGNYIEGSVSVVVFVSADIVAAVVSERYIMAGLLLILFSIPVPSPVTLLLLPVLPSPVVAVLLPGVKPEVLVTLLDKGTPAFIFEY
jgi:hypothetical protein